MATALLMPQAGFGDEYFHKSIFELTITEDEAYEFTLRVAAEGAEKTEIALFFQANSKSV